MEAREYELLDVAEDRMWWYSGLHRNMVSALGRFLPDPVGRILDCGCGTGGFLARLTADRAQDGLFGMEYAPHVARRAREKSGVPIVAGSINAMPLSEGSLDAVVCADVLAHRSVEPETAVAEVRRCLKPGGLFVVNVPAYQWLMSYHDASVHTVRRYTRKPLTALLRAGGFEVLNCTYWNMLPFPAMVARRKVLPRPPDCSDVAVFPPVLEALFGTMMLIEGWLLNLELTFPFGGSILAVAKKNA